MTEPTREQLASKADLVAQAADAIVAAVEAYQRAIASGPVLDSAEIIYTPSKALWDDHQFKIDPTNTLSPFRHDSVLQQAASDERPGLQALMLAFSPHYEDRIRAAALQESLSRDIALPDGFPCIYEPVSSPKRANALRPAPFVWVASPDEAMLHELLPLYRELWEAYENQWPHSPNRQFEIGRLDGLSPRGVYRPGTSPEQVIGGTMLVHEGMYRTAPEHLKQMHPRHAERPTSH